MKCPPVVPREDSATRAACSGVTNRPPRRAMLGTTDALLRLWLRYRGALMVDVYNYEASR